MACKQYNYPREGRMSISNTPQFIQGRHHVCDTHLFIQSGKISVEDVPQVSWRCSRNREQSRERLKVDMLVNSTYNFSILVNSTRYLDIFCELTKFQYIYIYIFEQHIKFQYSCEQHTNFSIFVIVTLNFSILVNSLLNFSTCTNIYKYTYNIYI